MLFYVVFMLLLHCSQVIIDLLPEKLNSDLIGQNDLLCQKSLMLFDVLIGLLLSIAIFVTQKQSLKQTAFFLSLISCLILSVFMKTLKVFTELQ